MQLKTCILDFLFSKREQPSLYIEFFLNVSGEQYEGIDQGQPVIPWLNALILPDNM